MISLDSETTGVDFWHCARPFFVTTCADDGEQQWWEWDVDPLTREVDVPAADVEAIKTLLRVTANWGKFPDAATRERHCLVLQNAKFDAHALATLGIDGWPWAMTRDTLIAGHLLASNHPHDLTSMAIVYLGIDIQPFEDALEVAVKEARRIARSEFPAWRIAKAGDPAMPSAKETTWKMDTWLPRAIAVRCGYAEDDPWHTVLRDYANADSSVTVALAKAMHEEINRRRLWEIYLERLKVLPVAFRMEEDGLTISKARLGELTEEYDEESAACGRLCVNIATSLGHKLELPKAGSNKSLDSFAFGPLGLPVLSRTEKTGKPSLSKAALDGYEVLEPGSVQLAFVRALRDKRKRDTALAYMEGYGKFMLPLGGGDDWHVIHPSLNATGTDTLRWSSSNPNEQNISKQKGFNLRRAFGPASGREWWSLDAQNIELRIPAFEAGEPVLMDVFNRPNDPPYFGSYHLAVFDVLHPELFAEHGKECKALFEDTWYQWVKNGNFAVIYGAQKDTADRAYHKAGAYAKIRERFPKIAKLNDWMIAFANKYGYVETIPDKAVCPERGYPLLCSRASYGGIMPTVPLNYHVQGTAMWWMAKAMVRCQAKLDEWRNGKQKFDGRIALQVHDELVFDFPKNEGNRWRIKILQQLMSKGGDDIGIPTPVSIEYHENNWGEGVTV